MHIEKNVFENIFNTVMDVKGKTKDNIKARLDLALFCNRKNMELVCDESRVTKPRASFVLEYRHVFQIFQLQDEQFATWFRTHVSPITNSLSLAR
jgi:hypothetical protein